ncbi:hypothetical protein ACFVW1_48235, partial [Streptomyces olivochromogenes]|uniref:hypothetical protein n=1 Tax=Streptomyces olivochromogenes TaxID=1963 RepID=UPI0036D97675
MPHTFKVCAYANNTAVAKLPQQGGVRTYLISPGQCRHLPVLSGTTYGNVQGFNHTHPDVKFSVGTLTSARRPTGRGRLRARRPVLS